MNEKKNYREELFYKQKNGYDLICNEDRKKIEPYCAEYMEFLNNSRTEREAVRNAVALAEAEGFREYNGGEVKAGDKIYYVNRNKALILAVIGEKPLAEGMNISAAHIDSPRLDLKQNP
ncbi:MAG: aminopeptidase, partial [Clostridiales bacterium]|nr:aminopeptidase [Clostridiales bacterium]